MDSGAHSWAKTALVTGYGVVAAVSATLYGALLGDEHDGGATLHTHGFHGAAGRGHAHPDAAVLVAGLGLGLVGLAWFFLPEARRRTVHGQLALCSAAAATIHFGVVWPHWDEYAPFAVLFAVVGAFQFAWAGAVLVRPVRGVLLIGAVTNLGVAGAWVLSRTAGLPVGPDAWTPEAIGAADVAATVLELAIVAGSATLLSSSARPLEDRMTRVAAQLTAIAIGVTLLVALTLL